MQELIRDIRDGRIGTVVVYKLDRLSRSQKDTLYLIEDVFLPGGVDFVSVQESFDTSTSFGKAMVGILSVFAQLERETIRERTRMGMRERVKSGLWMGGGRIPFGYDYDREKGVLVPNADAERVRKIYDLYLRGYSPARIAQVVGLKYDRLAEQILKRKSNAGYIQYNNEEYRGMHEPVVSLDTYEKAMEMMEQRSRIRPSVSVHLLTGLVYCGRCGARMRYQKWGKNGYKLCCYSQQKSKPYLVRDPDCANERVWAYEIEDALLDDLFRLSFKLDAEGGAAKSASVLDLLRQDYDRGALKVKRLYNLYAQNGDDLLQETIAENREELERRRKRMEDEKERQAVSGRQAEKKILLKDIKTAWDYMTMQEKQFLVRQCVERIVVTDNRAEIYYQFSM
jgi:site-specific DNA recombinase